MRLMQVVLSNGASLRMPTAATRTKPFFANQVRHWLRGCQRHVPWQYINAASSVRSEQQHVWKLQQAIAPTMPAGLYKRLLAKRLVVTSCITTPSLYAAYRNINMQWYV